MQRQGFANGITRVFLQMRIHGKVLVISSSRVNVCVFQSFLKVNKSAFSAAVPSKFQQRVLLIREQETNEMLCASTK
jgi:hypothetical protein